jgi:hypothetical protein
VSGALLMLFPLVYMVIKRNKKLKQWVIRYVSMKTLLSWHIYTGVVGPFLVILHSGHRFESPLGIILTGLTLIIVLSGFTGRYLMKQVSQTGKEHQAQLQELRAFYAYTMGQLASVAYTEQKRLKTYTGFFKRHWGRFLLKEEVESQGIRQHKNVFRALRLAEAMADEEYAIKSEAYAERIFKKWLTIHILLSYFMYILLGLHVFGAIYFGIRWFE